MLSACYRKILQIERDNMETILFKDVVKKYKSIIANDNLSFSVNKGEIFGLLGPMAVEKQRL